jgi:hypothetical protein
MDLLPAELQDLAILRRILFAAVYLPSEMPNYWDVITGFANNDVLKPLQPHSVKLAVENLRVINESIFATDRDLSKEIHDLKTSSEAIYPLGVVLVSSQDICTSCGGKLLLRKDRPSHITVYTESFGTVNGSHYHKFCQHFRKGCTFKQFYGYTSGGSEPQAIYDSTWSDNQYFISSSETAFEISMLKKFDVELLLGQISYSQKTDIYNLHNGYPVQPKRCSTSDKSELPRSKK